MKYGSGKANLKAGDEEFWQLADHELRNEDKS
ncbi:hypothetical protein GGD62_001481 [Bradyrhizobium sp. ERR14]|nr:hypothetical protein [Bradyrhizobium sp. ERR14]